MVLADARLTEGSTSSPRIHKHTEAKAKNAHREIRPHRSVDLRQGDGLESSRILPEFEQEGQRLDGEEGTSRKK